MMEFFSHPIPAVILLLGILVFVHELGHYVVGRWCGIAVEVFSIGFGPAIVGFRHRGTDYRLSWIPLGGFVKFAGAHPTEDLPTQLNGLPYREVSLAKRAMTIFAGPFANFLLAAAVYSVLGMSGIQHPPPLIGEVIEGSAAEAAGIRAGDVFMQIDDHPIKTWRDLEAIIADSPGRTLTVTVRREGQERQIALTPATTEVTDFTGKPVTVGRAGIARGHLPAVLTVTSADSPAAIAGLATGDKVVEVTPLSASKTSISSPTKIRSFSDLTHAVSTAVQDDATAFMALKVTNARVPGDHAVLQEGPHADRILHVAIGALRADKLKSAPGKDQMRVLGIETSQLTVGEASDTVAGVLKKGDRLLAWNNTPLRDVFALHEQLMANKAATAQLQVQRGFSTQQVDIQLKPVDVQRPDGVATIYTLPVIFWGQPEEPEPIVEQYSNPLSAVAYGIRETGAQTATLFDNVKSLFTGEVPLKALGGPMLIAKVAGDSARRGWQTFLTSMALISINLGLLNLFPIPVLDGGQLVLMGAEAIKRRPLRESAVENFQKVGFAMILALVVLATYNDLSRFWRSMLESVTGMFQ